MAKRNGSTASSGTSSTTSELAEASKPTVSLSIDDWKNVLATIEAGVKALGFTAFVVGGNLIQDITNQLSEQVDP